MININTQPAPLSIDSYKLEAFSTNQFQQDESGFQKIVFGYFGEIGGLLSAVKKANRDNLIATEADLAAEELGDALWYLINIANFLEVDANDIGQQCIKALRDRYKEKSQNPNTPVTFRQIDGLIDIHIQPGTTDRAKQLRTLAYNAGVLAKTSYQEYLSMPDKSRSLQLGCHLSELAITCNEFKLKLEDVARANLIKINSRWPKKSSSYPTPFDINQEPHERFPSTLNITFIERNGPTKGYVVQVLNDVFIGDRLTDNSNEPDDYRFHDVFHLAYLTFLGWSPVLRGLLKRKRKSDPKIDENEDGARAMIIEEGIATWIFNQAKRQNFFFDGAQAKLDYGMLKQIKNMTTGYEVEKCQLWQWEKAIIEGFKIFRELKEHRGGTVMVNVLEHTIDFAPPPKS